MKAMIFAAGLGTRLKPLTDQKPKALVDVAGKPMLYWVAEKLVKSGFSKIVINIHHYADMMKEAIEKLPFDAEFIISNEEGLLLDTGGGLLKAQKHFSGTEPFLVHNVDVISNINLIELYNYQMQQGGIATLAISQRETSRYFLWHNNRLAGWENTSTGEKIITVKTATVLERKAFSGIQVICPEIFKMINYCGKFSINKIYLDLAGNKDIFAFEHDDKYWFDLGTKEKIHKAEKIIKSMERR